MFEFLFKYPLAAFSRGELLFAGRWPTWVLVLLVLAAAAGLAWPLWRGRRISAPRVKPVAIWLLQTALVAMLLVLLWQPALSVATLRQQQNVVAVVVDDSKSMGLREDGQTRMENVKKSFNPSIIKDLESKFQVTALSPGRPDRARSVGGRIQC